MQVGVVGPDTLLSSSRPELRHIWTLAFGARSRVLSTCAIKSLDRRVPLLVQASDGGERLWWERQTLYPKLLPY